MWARSSPWIYGTCLDCDKKSDTHTHIPAGSLSVDTATTLSGKWHAEECFVSSSVDWSWDSVTDITCELSSVMLATLSCCCCCCWWWAVFSSSTDAVVMLDAVVAAVQSDVTQHDAASAATVAQAHTSFIYSFIHSSKSWFRGGIIIIVFIVEKLSSSSSSAAAAALSL